MQTADTSDFSDVKVNLLDANFLVQEDNFKQFLPNSLVILDDFQLRTKQSKLDFLRVINFTLRHNQITLFLIIHNLFGNYLFNDILFSPHLFLSCTNIGLSVLIKIHLRLGGKNVLDFYHRGSKSNFQFLYVNSKRNYLINNVQQLFDRNPTNVTMFTNQQEFVIHRSNTHCKKTELKNQPVQQILSDVNELIQTLYPKQKTLNIVTNLLLKHNTINQELCFVNDPSLHLADFLRFLNNTFDKNTKPDVKIIKMCKILQAENIRFPNVCVKNPVAKRYFC